MASNDSEMQPFNEHHGGGESDEEGEGGSDSVGLVGCCFCLCCCLVCFLLYWFLAPDLSCSDAPALPWNSYIPAVTRSQLANSWWGPNHVDVFSWDNVTKASVPIGKWTSKKQFLFSRAAYVFSTVVGDTEKVVMRAEIPWVWNWDNSKMFELFICNGDGSKYTIDEDKAAQPWIEFGSKTRNYDITNPQGVRVATSTHVKNDVFSFGGAHWTVVVKTVDGVTTLALIQQKSFSETGWFEQQAYEATNYAPLILPNEVISLMSSVFDLVKKDEQDDDNNDNRRLEAPSKETNPVHLPTVLA